MADVSSYALPTQKSPLELAGGIADVQHKFGALQQQQQQIQSGGLTIDKQKLDLINTQFGLMNQELSTLINDPSISKEQAAKRLTTFADTYKFPPQVSQHMLSELQAAKDVQTFAKTALTRGMATQEKVNNLYGQPGFVGNGQTATPVVTSPMLNRGLPKPVGIPIQQQIPPSTETVDENNVPRLQGPTPAVLPPGTAAGPQLLPIAPTPQNFRSGLTTQAPNQVVQDRNPYPAASGPAVGTTPLFEEGKKQYSTALANAGAKMQAAKPAIQALPLMSTPGFLSGPLTDQFTNAVATLKSVGFIDTASENDPTVIRQEVVKKLANYLSNSPVGQRSDAAQTLKEAASPSPKVQLLPALIKLTKDAVALDRVEAAMPNAFKSKDYSKFGSHMATFPQSVDERAFTLDLETEDKAKSLVDGMAKRLQSKSQREVNEANKFFKSLRIAKEQGFYQ